MTQVGSKTFPKIRALYTINWKEKNFPIKVFLNLFGNFSSFPNNSIEMQNNIIELQFMKILHSSLASLLKLSENLNLNLIGQFLVNAAFGFIWVDRNCSKDSCTSWDRGPRFETRCRPFHEGGHWFQNPTCFANEFCWIQSCKRR